MADRLIVAHTLWMSLPLTRVETLPPSERSRRHLNRLFGEGP